MINKLMTIYKKYEEQINYIIIGGITTLISIASFKLLNLTGMDPLISNVISWILAVTFAYFTNKTIVFKNKDKNSKQVFDFIFYRLVTLGIEEAIIYVMINLLSIDDLLTKVVAQIVVFIANYLFSKLIVFKKSKN